MKLRYRIWDGKKMWYPEDDEGFQLSQNGWIQKFDTTGHCNGNGDPLYQIEYIDIKAGDFVLIPMLSTGLKDKNGKEIWEGDVFNLLGDAYNVISSKNTVELADFLGGHYWQTHHRGSTVYEVTGNIYEKKVKGAKNE